MGMKINREVKRIIYRKCPHCRKKYRPDPRVAKWQIYCDAAACQAESKRVSQVRWIAKNEGYFTEGSSTERSRACRARKRAGKADSEPQSAAVAKFNATLPVDSQCLGDLSSLVATREVQQEMIGKNEEFNVLITGLLCLVTGVTQQDEMDEVFRKVLSLGQDALGLGREQVKH